MVVTPAIRDLILEAKINEIRDFIADGRETYQMQTFDQHLVDLVNSDLVSFEVAKAALDQVCSGITGLEADEQISRTAQPKIDGKVRSGKLKHLPESPPHQFGLQLGPDRCHGRQIHSQSLNAENKKSKGSSKRAPGPVNSCPW